MSNELAKREYEAYRKDDAQARAIIDSATEQNRATTPEEDERFDRLVESAGKHKDFSDRLGGMDVAAAAATRALRSIGLGNTDTTDGLGQTRTADPIREMLDAHETRASFDMPTSSQLRSIDEIPNPYSDYDGGNTRAIAEFSDSAKLFSSDFATTVSVYLRTLSPWVSLATIDQRDEARPTIYPDLSTDSTSYKPGEGTAITESTPTLGTATATPLSYKGLAYVSQEAWEDTGINLSNIVAFSQARSIGLGFGSDATAAILAAATNGGTATGLGGVGTGTATFFGFEDLLDLKYGAASGYRDSGSWVMANGAIKKSRKFRDGQGNYFWPNSLAAGQPPTFDGSGLAEDPYLAAPASATKSVVFGDVSKAIIRCSPMRVAISSDYLFNTDQIALKTVWRAAIVLPDAAAIRYLVSANT